MTIRAKTSASIPEHGLDELLEKVYTRKGWDFRHYKKTSLKRRIAKRLGVMGATTYGAYCALLDSDPAEYDRLFDCIAINVSEFFREPEVFDILGREIASFRPGERDFKIWCCACASGEEAYSTAILLSETLDIQRLSLVRLYATDIDRDAIEDARRGAYKDEFLANVSPALLHKYFVRAGAGAHSVNGYLRGMVKFGTLDVVRDSAISRVDLLFCRNLFIYFDKKLQEEVFAKLDFALNRGGLMVLGRAEVVPQPFKARYSRVAEGTSVYRKNG